MLCEVSTAGSNWYYIYGVWRLYGKIHQNSKQAFPANFNRWASFGYNWEYVKGATYADGSPVNSEMNLWAVQFSPLRVKRMTDRYTRRCVCMPAVLSNGLLSRRIEKILFVSEKSVATERRSVDKPAWWRRGPILGVSKKKSKIKIFPY